MTVILDNDNKTILSFSSGGFVNKELNTRDYNGLTHEYPEEVGNYEWDDINKKIITKGD